MGRFSVEFTFNNIAAKNETDAFEKAHALLEALEEASQTIIVNQDTLDMVVIEEED